MKRPSVLVIGELNVDIVATGLRGVPEMGAEILAQDCELTLGSASAIFAVGMSKLGHKVTFVSQVGRDSFGDFCITTLKHLGIATSNVLRKSDEKTGVTLALSGRRDRALITYPGAIASLTADRANHALLKQHDHVHLTSYYLQKRLQPSFGEILQHAKALGLTTSFDPNSDPSDRWNSKINSVLKHTDILFVNEREAIKLSRAKTAQAALKMLGEKTPCVVVKRGAKGAIAIQNNELFTDPGFRVKALDTTGAGDSFDAGFLSAYLMKEPVSECLRIGNACGALSAISIGGTAGQPTQTELQEFIQSNHPQPI
ncbi:MAG TPA: carbohydrate kinase family protein [Pyrinomonadaceae bacterium]|jgi:sugar/nucleoside kinase (ribokinase family)|nr:carbohydrate kinase family protein [Pyrinomonadaceae bacterium]